jgi:diamine N-acetyltransferase
MRAGEQIFLRATEPGDIDFLYDLENDPGLWRVSNTSGPYSRHVLEEYIQNSVHDIFVTRQQRFIICTQKSKTPVGCVDLFDFEPLHRRAGIGIVITHENRGNGFAAEALDLLLEHCKKVLNLYQVYASVLEENEAGKTLFLSRGFSMTGTRKGWILWDGNFQDESFLQKTLEA